MSKARGLADLGNQVDDGAITGTNMVINGGMTVAQRATSVTGFGGGSDAYTTVDRWKFDVNSTMAGRMTIEQVDDSPNGISGKSLKLSCTTADTSIGSAERFQIQQRFEGQNLQSIGKGTPDAKPITVSFYVKANASFTYGLEFYDADNGRQITKLFNTTTDWERIELTFPADTTGAFNNDQNNSLYLIFAIHAGSDYAGGTLNSDAWAPAVNANRAVGIDSFYSSTDNELFITGVCLNVGDSAIDFPHESYGDTLAKCQRYFEKVTGTVWLSTLRSGDDLRRGTTSFAVTKRASPSIVITSQVLDGASSISGSADVSIASFSSAGQGTFDAPRVSEFTADAEL
jgi:hypothetical protein